MPCPSHPEPSAGRMPLTAWHEAHASCTKDYTRKNGYIEGWRRGRDYMLSGVVSGEQCCCGGWHGPYPFCKRRLWCGPHRVTADHSTSELDVRALDARVHDVNTHTLTSEVAVVELAVGRAACTHGIVKDDRSSAIAGSKSR